MRCLRLVLAILLVAALTASRDAQAEKLRDLVLVEGARDNQLVGYGIVAGLQGTGDDASVPFAEQSTLSLLRRLGVQIDGRQVRLRNVAAVAVTATLPPFAHPGTRVDVAVTSIGNARSLAGGVLVQAVLKGADGHAYAVAQGSVLVGGYDARGATGSSATSGATNAGRIPGGAIVEREIPAAAVGGAGQLRLELRTPGYGTAVRVSDAICAKLGAGAATAVDGGAVVVRVPAESTGRIPELVARLEEVEVAVVRPARVVVSERTGTIVAGGDVRLAPVVLVHGALTVVVRETPTPSQPVAPFGTGSTVVVPKSELDVRDPPRAAVYLAAAPSLADVATALGALGLSPRELVSVLQALRTAGALEAEVVVQ